MKIMKWILIPIATIFFSCNKTQLKEKVTYDTEEYEKLWQKVFAKNYESYISAQFNSIKCENLIISFVGKNKKMFFDTLNKELSLLEFKNLIKIEIWSKNNSIPSISNKYFNCLSLYGIDTLVFSDSHPNFEQLRDLRLQNLDNPLKVFFIASDNNLNSLTISHAQIKDLNLFAQSIRNIEFLNLENNKIKHVGKLPFKSGTKIYLAGNPIEDTLEIKKKNPDLLFYF